MTAPTLHNVQQGTLSLGYLLAKHKRNRNGVRCSYDRGRWWQTAKNRTREGLAAWFLGFADACADGEAPRMLP